MELYLGIDTSCYTTSLAVVDGEGNLFSEARQLLTVPEGGRGLAQNEAVFQHIANLPGLVERVAGDNGLSSICCVAAGARPRPVAGSYMPVFRVAESFGRSLAAVLGVPFVAVSHQEGHLAAGVWSANGPDEDEFLAVHISGGTTEILRVCANADGNTPGQGDDGSSIFDIRILGGTTDLHAGQFIDRVGVSMGLPFPAGPALEQLARGAPESSDVVIPSSVKGYNISFSGPEAAARRLLEREKPSAEIARAVEKCVANSLEKLINKAVGDTGLCSVLIVGGVAANLYIRERLLSRLGQEKVKVKIHFASPGLSSDNAVGVALLGRRKIRER